MPEYYKGLVKSINLKDKKIKIGDSEFEVFGKATAFLASKVNAGDSVDYGLDNGKCIYVKKIPDSDASFKQASEVPQAQKPNSEMQNGKPAVSTPPASTFDALQRRITREWAINAAVGTRKICKRG